MEEDSGGGTESPITRSSANSSNKEQDRFLPIANVGRIMKKVLPVNGKISKDAKETVQECVSEFISFVTGEASDKCQREKRKTINGDDVIWAITTLGFEDYVNPLKIYLDKFKETEGERLNLPKHQQHHHQQQLQQQRVVNHNNNSHHQQQQQQQQQELEKERGLFYGNVFSSSTTGLGSPSLPFVCDEQSFPLPFSSTSSSPQLHHHLPLHQEHLESSTHW